MTRYPKSGKGRRWTILELKAITAAWRGDTISDGDGLVGEVRVARDNTVSLVFRCAFRWEGKLSWHYCGTWPTASLDDVRTERDNARRLIKLGVDPRAEKVAARIEAQAKVDEIIKKNELERAADLPFSAMFAAWTTDGVSRADGNTELRRSFDKDVLPHIGSKPVRLVSEADLLALLRKVGRERGRGRTAEVLLANLRQLFRWAEKRQPWRVLLIEGNPAELVDLKQVVTANYSDAPRDRILTPVEIQELHVKFAKMEATYLAAEDRRAAPRPVQKETQLALWLCLSTACRIGELLKARWEHVNFSTAEWFVPAADTKTKEDWTVRLSPFALRAFKELQEISGKTPWCFPARSKSDPVCPKSVSKQVGDRQACFKARTVQLKNRRQDNSLVLADGERGEWTPHDLRRTAATMMQQLGILPDIIDRCQNHVLAGSKVRRHYMHHDYADETRAAWNLLGQRLETILETHSNKGALTITNWAIDVSNPGESPCAAYSDTGTKCQTAHKRE